MFRVDAVALAKAAGQVSYVHLIIFSTAGFCELDLFLSVLII